MKRKNKGTRSEGRNGMVTVYFFTIIFVLVFPLVYLDSTLDPAIYPRLSLLSAGMAVLVVLLISLREGWKLDVRIFRNPFIVILSLFILLTILSLIYAINPLEGLTDLFRHILLLVFVVLAQRIIHLNSKAHQVVLKALIISAFIAVSVGVYQLFTLTLPWSDPNVLYEVKGLMAHKNQYSISLFLLLPFMSMGYLFLEKNWKKYAVSCAGLIVLMILILQTRAVWAALLISLLMLSLLFLLMAPRIKVLKAKTQWIRKLIFGGLILLFLGSLATWVARDIFPFNKIAQRIETVFDPDYASNQWRVEMWTASKNLFADHLWSGVGAGNWKVEIYPYYSEFLPSVFKHWRNPHNDYLWVGSEKGLPGLVLYVLMFLTLIWQGLKLILKAKTFEETMQAFSLLFGLIGYMVISFFSFPMERMYPLIMIGLMAAFLILPDQDRSPGKKPVIVSKWASVPLLVVLYAAFHYGVQCTITEINVAKAQKAYESKNWNQLKQYSERAYSAIVPFEPRFSLPVITYRGFAYFHQDKDYKKALACFLKAHSQHPNQIMVINNIGSVYGQMGDYPTSGEFYKKTLEIFPHYENGLLNLAKAYYLQNRFDLAYQTILACDPRSENSEILAFRRQIEKMLDETEGLMNDEDSS